MFLVFGAKFRHSEFSGSPRMNALKTVDPFRQRKLDKWFAKSQKRRKIGDKLLLFSIHTGSCIRAFDWYQNWLPWMTLNGWMATLFCVQNTNSVALEPITSKWLKLDPYCLLQNVDPKNPLFGKIQSGPEKMLKFWCTVVLQPFAVSHSFTKMLRNWATFEYHIKYSLLGS